MPRISTHHTDIKAARQRRDREIIRRAENGESLQSIADRLRMTRQRASQVWNAHKKGSGNA